MRILIVEDEFKIADASHELKTPVAIIMANAEALEKVSNKGKEITKEIQEKIFERFYRADESRNRNEKRYGLGLAIAKSIVEKYKGIIKVFCKNGIKTFETTLYT